MYIDKYYIHLFLKFHLTNTVAVQVYVFLRSFQTGQSVSSQYLDCTLGYLSNLSTAYKLSTACWLELQNWTGIILDSIENKPYSLGIIMSSGFHLDPCHMPGLAKAIN